MSQFVCPRSMAPHVQQVLAGEYDAPGVDLVAPRVLDIGANVGAYSLWASKRWPGARITAYEPVPSNAALWRTNLAGVEGVELVQAAVMLGGGTVRLYGPRNNCGEWSRLQRPNNTDEAIDVPSVEVEHGGIPFCDVLKVDTEGCEVKIIVAYLHRVITPCVVAYEWHSPEDREALTRCLTTQDDVNYALVRDVPHPHGHTGVCVWVRQ